MRALALALAIAAAISLDGGATAQSSPASVATVATGVFDCTARQLAIAPTLFVSSTAGRATVKNCIVNTTVIVTLTSSDSSVELRNITFIANATLYIASSPFPLRNVHVLVSNVTISNTAVFSGPGSLLNVSSDSSFTLEDVRYAARTPLPKPGPAVTVTPLRSLAFFHSTNCTVTVRRIAAEIIIVDANSICANSTNCTVSFEDVKSLGISGYGLANSTQATLRVTRCMAASNFVANTWCLSAIGCDVTIVDFDAREFDGAFAYLAMRSTNNVFRGSRLSSSRQLHDDVYGHFLRLGVGSVNLSVSLDDIGPGSGFFDGPCGNSVGCVFNATRLHDLRGSILLFSLRSRVTSAYPQNNTLVVTNSWNLNYCITAPCAFSQRGCVAVIENLWDLTNYTLSFIGSFSKASRVRIRGLSRLSNRCLVSPFAASASGSLELSDVTRVDDSFLQYDPSIVEQLSLNTACGSSSLCTFVLGQYASQLPMLAGNITVWNISDVTGVESMLGMLSYSVASNVTMSDVTDIGDDVAIRRLGAQTGFSDLCPLTGFVASVPLFGELVQIYGGNCNARGTSRIDLRNLHRRTGGAPIAVSGALAETHDAIVSISDTCMPVVVDFCSAGANCTLLLNNTTACRNGGNRLLVGAATSATGAGLTLARIQHVQPSASPATPTPVFTIDVIGFAWLRCTTAPVVGDVEANRVGAVAPWRFTVTPNSSGSAATSTPGTRESLPSTLLSSLVIDPGSQLCSAAVWIDVSGNLLPFADLVAALAVLKVATYINISRSFVAAGSLDAASPLFVRQGDASGATPATTNGAQPLAAAASSAAVSVDMSWSPLLSLTYQCGAAVPSEFVVSRAGSVVALGPWLGFTPAPLPRGAASADLPPGIDGGGRRGPCWCTAPVVLNLSSPMWRSECAGTQSRSESRSVSAAGPTHTTSHAITERVAASECPTLVAASSDSGDGGSLLAFTMWPAVVRARAIAAGPVTVTLRINITVATAAASIDVTRTFPPLSWSSSVASGGQLSLRVAPGTADAAALGAVLPSLTNPRGGYAIRASGQVLNLTLGRAAGLRIARGATLELAIGSEALSCSGSPALVIGLPVEPYIDAQLASAEVAAVSTAVIAATVGGTLSSAAVGDAQAMAVFGSVACASSSASETSSRAAFILGPLHVGSSDASTSALLGTFVLLALCLAVQLSIIGVLFVGAKARGTTRIWGVKGGEAASSAVDMLARAASVARFPGLLFSAMAVAQVGTAFHSTRLLLSGGLSITALAGAMMSVAVVAVVPVLQRRYATPTFDVDATGVMSLYKYEHTTDFLAPGSGWAPLLRFAAPVGRWESALVVRRFGQPFRSLRPVWLSMAVAPPLQGLLVGFVGGIPVAPTSVMLCAAQIGMVALVPIVFAAAAVLARPYVTPVLHCEQAASAVTVAFAAMAVIGMLHAQADGSVPDGWVGLAEVATIAQGCILVLRTAHIVVMKVIDVLVLHHDGRRVIWVEGMTPHQVEHLDRDTLLAFVGTDDTPEEEAIEMALRRDREESMPRPVVPRGKKKLDALRQAVANVVQAAT